MIQIRCLLNTIVKTNIQNGPARCDKTLNQFITKDGNQIQEVICDYGKGLRTKSEVSSNKIVNIGPNGDAIEYVRGSFGDVLIKNGNEATLSRNPNLWKELLFNIFKGF